MQIKFPTIFPGIGEGFHVEELIVPHSCGKKTQREVLLRMLCDPLSSMNIKVIFMREINNQVNKIAPFTISDKVHV